MNGPIHMDTSHKLNHVYGCAGATFHVTPGITLLRAGDLGRCPVPGCGAPVQDITNTPVGQHYIAFARLDLGEKPR